MRRGAARLGDPTPGHPGVPQAGNTPRCRVKAPNGTSQPKPVGAGLQPGTKRLAANQGHPAARSSGDAASPNGSLSTVCSVALLHGTHPAAWHPSSCPPAARPLPTIPRATLALSRPRCCLSPSLGHHVLLPLPGGTPRTVHPMLPVLGHPSRSRPRRDPRQHPPPPGLGEAHPQPCKDRGAGHGDTLSPATSQAVAVTPRAPLPPGQPRTEKPGEGTGHI